MTAGPPSAAVTHPTGRWLWLAFAWGLAESTFFFLVPDMLSSRLVLTKPRTGFAACFSSLAGALLGGLVLYFLGRDRALVSPLLAALDLVPGVSPGLIGSARTGLEQHGPAALFAGFIGGIPYKLYAVQAAGAGLGLGAFLAASAGARLARFLVVTGLAWFVGTIILPNSTALAKLRLHSGAWLLFYLLYFWKMGI